MIEFQVHTHTQPHTRPIQFLCGGRWVQPTDQQQAAMYQNTQKDTASHLYQTFEKYQLYKYIERNIPVHEQLSAL